jgi:Putative beta-barrel porin-2, OmpL-like. bbp2
VDVYYSFNANHPAGGCNASLPATCGNQLYNFNGQPNQFSLNMLKLSAAHAPDPVGFQVDFGFGRAFDIISAGEKNPEIFRYIEQAYASFKPAKLHGVEFDFGKFVTSAGAEVIETPNNWNYSRSLLFAWAIPYYHFGLRMSFPVGKYFTGGVQVVNGWNNVEDNNSGKTVGLNGTFTTKKFTWGVNYYGGPENPSTNQGWRQVFDTTLTLTPPGKVNAYINYDYGQNRCVVPAISGPDDLCATTSGFFPPLSVWTGVAGAVHIQATSKWAITPRFEWFNDHEGFSTGTPQHVKEGTLTVEYKLLEGLLARGEYRYDWSDQPFFNRFDLLAVSKHQTTATLGVVAFFGPKR